VGTVYEVAKQLSYPTLSPISQQPAIVLPSVGDPAEVVGSLPFGIYASDQYFISGAVDQVAFTYKMLGGDVLDIELTQGNVYAAYEAAVLEYSHLINLHQAKNVLGDMLGGPTGSFNHDGEYSSGSLLSASLSNPVSGALSTPLSLRYAQIDLSAVRDVADGFSQEVNVGGKQNVYSASVDVVTGQQDYDLQNAVQELALSGGVDFANLVATNRIVIRKVYYRTPRAMWRFYGFYGGLTAIGNLSTYGMYSDDSTFEVIPVWQNKAQAMAYEDAIYTRTSHFSYELKNNKLRIFPRPFATGLRKIWFEFTISGVGENYGLSPDILNGTSSEVTVDQRIGGVNNINTLPFANIPFSNINSIGKHWIRRYALAIAKGMLGQVRSKFATVPIPGESVTLNGAELLSSSDQEKEALRNEMMEYLETVSYKSVHNDRADMNDAVGRILQQIPNALFVG
jgi:hypothetical protein